MCQTIDPSWVDECPFSRLLVSWRTGTGQRRHIIGELTIADDGLSFFAYATDLSQAKSVGFLGYPGLPLDQPINQKTAIDLFLRRLINTEREDALRKLSFWGVTQEQLSNKLYLLGVTQGQSSSDEYEFLPILYQREQPYKFVTAIAGLRYFDVDPATISEGEKLELQWEQDNNHDPYAVAVKQTNGRTLGYLKQGINQLFARLGTSQAEVIRIIDTGYISQVFIECFVPPRRL
ncbi:MAG: HIRAN domain-containing protein [Porphyromonadaceae bacterium]|nr:HIRAN domain-containing protein [Porphyromonadaceae bacterium]